MTVRRASLICLKEFRSYWSDPQMMLFSFLLPLVTLVVFAGAFSGQGQFAVNGYAVDLDQSTESADFLSRLDAVPGINLRVITLQEAERRLDRADISTCIVVPAGFGGQVSSGETLSLEVRQRGYGGTEGQILKSYAATVAGEMTGEARRVAEVASLLRQVGLSLDTAEVAAAVSRYASEAAADPPVSVEEHGIAGGPKAVTFFLPGLVTMFAIFAVALSSQTVVTERKNGTLERLMTTRLKRGELLAGKFLAGMARTYAQIALLFVVGGLAFAVFTPASFVQSMLFSLAVVAAGSALGVFVSALARTPDQAIWGSVFTTNAMAMLGGTFFELPETGPLNVISRLTLNRYAVDAYRALINRGATLATPQVATNFAILVGVAVVLMAIAVPAFKVRRD